MLKKRSQEPDWGSGTRRGEKVGEAVPTGGPWGCQPVGAPGRLRGAHPQPGVTEDQQPELWVHLGLRAALRVLTVPASSATTSALVTILGNSHHVQELSFSGSQGPSDSVARALPASVQFHNQTLIPLTVGCSGAQEGLRAGRFLLVPVTKTNS